MSNSSNLDNWISSACHNGLQEQIIQLIQQEDSRKRIIEFKDSKGQTPVHLGAANGHIEVVKTLLMLGVPLNERDLMGRSPLHLACIGGHLELVKLLVTHGVHLDHVDDVHGNTGIHEAAWKGFSQTVDFLAGSKCSLHVRNKGGFSALHLCCQNGHNETCRVLLRFGCKPNIKNNYGDTPLHTATRYGHAGVARILHSARCNINAQNKNGDTALHIASAMGRRKLVKILLESGANQSLLNLQGENPKDIAKRKDLALILELLENPPSLTPIDEHLAASVMDGKTPQRKRGSRRKTVPNWSPYGCHYFPDITEFPEPRPETIPSVPLCPGEQYYLDLGGNIKKGPASNGYVCYCAPFFRNFEKKINHDRKEIVKHLNSCHGKLENRLLHLEKRTQDQISQLTYSMKESFDQERLECADRQDRRAIRDKLLQDRVAETRDDAIKGDLSDWLDAKVEEGAMGVLARGAFRGSKRRRKGLLSEIASGSIRRAVSQDDLLEEGVKSPTQMMMISYDDEASTYVVRKSPALPPRRPPPYRPPPHQMPPIKENGLSVLPARLWQSNSSPLTLSNGTNSEGGDSHNDSGYYTRTGIPSSGPSPSLSGSRPQSRALLDICSYSSSSSSQSIAPKIRDLQQQLARATLDPLPQGSLV